MSRKVNLKAVALLLAALAVLGGTCYLLRDYQIRRNAKSLLVQADRAGDNKQKELKYLRAYLGLAPRDRQVRTRYALLTSELARTTGEREFAYYLLEDVLRKDPANVEARKKAVQFAVSLARPNDALHHLHVLDELAGGKDGECLETMGDVESSRRDWKKAEEWYAKAVRVDPKRISSAASYASLLRKHLNQPEEAEQVIARMVEANSSSPDAEVARIRFLREGSQPPDKQAELRNALGTLLERYGGTHPELLLLAANMDAESGAIQSARSLYQKGHKLHPKLVEFPRELARIELRAGNRAEAVKLLRSVADNVRPLAADYWLTVELLIQAGDKDRASKLVKDVPRDEATAGLVDYLEAHLAFADERWVEAARLLTRARQNRRVSPEMASYVNLLLSRCHQQMGNPDGQLDAAQASLQNDPLWVPGRLARADALVATGKRDEALAVYEAIKDQIPVARLAAARLLAARTLTLPLARRDWTPSLALLDGAPPALRDSPDALALRGRILAARGDLKAAVEALEAACKSHPKEPVLWLALADAADEGGKGGAAAVLDRAEKAAGDRIELRLARAELLARRGEADSWAKLIDQAEKDAESKETAQRRGWLLAVGNFRLARGDLPGADKTFTRLSQLHPLDVGTWNTRFEIATARGQAEQLLPIVEQLKKLEGDEGTRWRYGKAVALAAQGKPADARALLVEVRKRRPSWARTYALEGRIDELEGHREKAAGNYRAALDRGDASPDLIARLVRLLHRQKQFQEAAAVLGRVQADVAPGELGRLATITSVMSGETNKAAFEAASKKHAADSKDPLDHLLRGRLLRAALKFDEAEAAYRRAIDLGPREPETHFTLVAFLVEQFPDKAAAAIERAEKDLPATASLVLGACHELNGNRKRADAYYLAALQAAPNETAVLRTLALSYLRRGQPASAESLLRRMIAQEKSDPTAAAYARRTLALTLAATGDYARYKEALALIEENARGGDGLGPEDQRARALLMARQPRDRREAIRTLEASFARISPTPEEDFFLASLLVAERDWPAANLRLIRLLTSRNGANPSFIVFYVVQLLNRNEPDKAEPWVKRLGEIEPGSLRAVGSKAKLLHAKKQSGEARRLLRADADAHAKDAARQFGLARLMDSLGFADDAEKAFRAYAASKDKEPRVRIPLIQFLGRRNRVGEALEECAKVRSSLPEEVFAEVAVGVLRDGEPTEAQSSRVVGWLEEARKQSKAPTALTLALANVSDLRGDAAAAIGYYRDLLKRDDRNLLAYNNLAVLLALREGKHAEALANVEKALDLAGPQPDVLDTKGLVLLSAGKAAPAIEALEQATAMDPDPASFFRLASAYLKANNRRAARAAWQEAKTREFTPKLLHPLERPEALKALAILEEK